MSSTPKIYVATEKEANEQLKKHRGQRVKICIVGPEVMGMFSKLHERDAARKQAKRKKQLTSLKTKTTQAEFALRWLKFELFGKYELTQEEAREFLNELKEELEKDEQNKEKLH